MSIDDATPAEWDAASRAVQANKTSDPCPQCVPGRACKTPTCGRLKLGANGTSALDVQIAGGHYKGLKIQPIQYIHANNIPFAEGCAIKYLTRWRDKGGIEDLKKARHFIDLLIELESK